MKTAACCRPTSGGSEALRSTSSRSGRSQPVSDDGRGLGPFQQAGPWNQRVHQIAARFDDRFGHRRRELPEPAPLLGSHGAARDPGLDITGELRQHLSPRPVRVAGAGGGVAGASRNDQVGMCHLRPSDKLTHQRGLAGARFAGDECDRSLPGQHRAEHPFKPSELRLAGDEDRRLRLRRLLLEESWGRRRAPGDSRRRRNALSAAESHKRRVDGRFQLARRLESVLGPLFKTTVDQPLRHRRSIDDERRYGSRLLLKDRRGGVGAGFTLERSLPGDHLVEHNTKREDIGQVVDGQASGLLR